MYFICGTNKELISPKGFLAPFAPMQSRLSSSLFWLIREESAICCEFGVMSFVCTCTCLNLRQQIDRLRFGCNLHVHILYCWFRMAALTNMMFVYLEMLLISVSSCFNTLRPRQNGRHFPDDIFKCIFLNENIWTSIKFSLKFVPMGPINNILALIQIMAWRRPGDKPLSEPMMVRLPTQICVTRPQWVKDYIDGILSSLLYWLFC